MQNFHYRKFKCSKRLAQGVNTFLKQDQNYISLDKHLEPRQVDHPSNEVNYFPERNDDTLYSSELGSVIPWDGEFEDDPHPIACLSQERGDADLF